MTAPDETTKALDRSRVYPGLIDSHCHLDLVRHRGIDTRRLLENLANRGMGRIIDVSVRGDDLDTRMQDADSSLVFHTVGVHPSEAGEIDPATAVARIDRWASDPRVVAVGEIGLDAVRPGASPQVALRLFHSQIEAAARHGLPVVVHNRESDDAVFAALDGFPRPVVLHCFSSGTQTAERAAAAGYFCSFAGNLTFGKNDELRSAATRLPVDLLLVETDAPYLAPEPFRGRNSHPGLVGHTLERLADLRGVEPEWLATIVAANLDRAMPKSALP